MEPLLLSLTLGGQRHSIMRVSPCGSCTPSQELGGKVCGDLI